MPGEEVKLVDGKFVKTGKKAAGNGGKPPKYPYPQHQYDGLLKVAKADGLDIGETKAKNTQAVNTMTGLIIDAFVADRSRAQK